MQSQHFVGTVAQKAIIEQDGKILLCRGKGDSLWELPGGRLHNGESPQEGIARELKEELNIDAIVGQPIYVTRSYHMRDKQSQMFIVYACSISNNQAIQPDNTEIDEVRWINPEELASVSIFDDCAQALNVYTRK